MLFFTKKLVDKRRVSTVCLSSLSYVTIVLLFIKHTEFVIDRKIQLDRKLLEERSTR